MTLNDFIDNDVEIAAENYFVGENIGGLKVDGISFNVEALGEYHIWLSGDYNEDFMYMLKNSDYYGDPINKISKSLNEIAESAQDRPDNIQESYIQLKVDELWKTVEDSYDSIFENIVEGLNEQLMYASNSFKDSVSNQFIDSQVGGVDIQEFKIDDYFKEISSRVSIILLEQASVDLLNFNKETLEEYVKSY